MPNFCFRLMISLCLTLVFVITPATGKPLIVTSITPLASLVKMLTSEEADIEALQTTSGCPHHMQLRPSQIEKIKRADLLIYIDDKFETSLTRYFQLSKNSLKISQFQEITFINNNWHLWLDIDNALNFLKIIKPQLEQLGLPADILESNYQLAVNDLNQLKQKLAVINQVDFKKLLIVSDSLRYLLSIHNIPDFYVTGEMSLKRYNELSNKLKDSERKICILASNTQNPKLLNNLFYNHQLVILAGENWPLLNSALDKLYLQSMTDIINQVESCLQILE